MNLDDLIYEEGCAGLRFKAVPLRAFEVWVFESGRADWQESRIPLDEGTPRIAPWLNAQTVFKSARHLGQSHVHAAQTSVVGGLRLLVQKWTKQDGILDSDTPIMPFLKADFDLITEQLCLPRSFPLDFARCQQIPAEVKHISTRYGERLAITCQSPRLKTCMTLVLSHDPESRVTSGFFGYTLDEGDEIVSMMKKSAHLVLHPLLIPALIHSTWFKIMFDQYAQIHRQMRSAQQRTGVMKRYLNKGRSKMRKFDKMTQENHDDIHETIVEQHAYLSTALSDFVGNLGPATTEAMETVRKLNPAAYHDYGLQAYVGHWTMRVERELEHREQLLKRIDVQIQVLYTLMQQRDSRTNIDIAEETRRDSSAMKSLALITTIFLPTTALATIFSMSAFFSDASDGSGRLVVSSQFWLFWAVAAPITIAIVIIWFLWINRKQVKKLKDSRKRRVAEKDIEAKSDSSSDSNRGTRHKRRGQASRPIYRRYQRWNGY